MSLLGWVSQLYMGTLGALLLFGEGLRVPILIVATVYAPIIGGDPSIDQYREVFHTDVASQEARISTIPFFVDAP